MGQYVVQLVYKLCTMLHNKKGVKKVAEKQTQVRISSAIHAKLKKAKIRTGASIKWLIERSIKIMLLKGDRNGKM